MKNQMLIKFFHDLINKISIVVILLERNDGGDDLKEYKQQVFDMISNSQLPDDMSVFLHNTWALSSTYDQVIAFCDMLAFCQKMTSFAST
jgi:hypothetical protein